MVRHTSSLTIACITAISGVLAASVSAQPIVSTTGAVADTCVGPSQTGCSRGFFYLVNGDTLQVDATVDLWRGRNDVVVQKLVVHPSGTLVYVAQSDRSVPPTSHWIDVIDLRTLTKVATYNVAGDLREISPDGTRLFLVTTSSVLVIDSANGGLVSTIPATLPAAIAIARSGNRIYVAQGPFQSFSIAVLDGASAALLQTIPLPQYAGAIKLTPDDSHLYALAQGSRIFDIDTASNTVVGTITDFGGPSSPNDLTFALGRAYVAASLQSGGISCCEYIAVIDVATRTLVAKILTVDPIFVEASADGSRVWTHTLGEPRLITIDTATNQIIGRVTVPGGISDPAAVPTLRTASVVIDEPSAGNAVQEPFDISGWAVDVMGLLPGPGIDTVHVWAFPAGGGAPIFLGADYGRPRPDVGALFGPSFTNSGYRVTVRGLAPGGHTLVAYGHSTRTGAFTLVKSVTVTVAPSVRLVVDQPRAGTVLPQPFEISGWAIDGAAQSGTGIDAIHVWAFPNAAADPSGQPVFLGAPALSEPRPDVATSFGPEFLLSGYRLTVNTLSRAPGAAYDLVIYAHDVATGRFSVAQQVSVQIAPATPYLFIDVPTSNTTVGTTFLVAGWAAEVNGASGTGVDLVHVWATSPSGAATFLGQAEYGIDRPDVGAYLGSRYVKSGFGLIASLPPGDYFISVYARSSTFGTFRTVRVVAVRVQ